MVAIAHLRLEHEGADPWPRLAEQAAAWAEERDVSIRDAVVLVPFAQHLPLTRQAWARRGGWPPRIETTMTLSRSLAPPAPAQAGQLCFDTALDRLVARRLMLGQAWGRNWQRRDMRGFEHAVNTVVDTAQALGRAASAVAPGRRAAHWARGRDLLGAGVGPGGTERLLARIALEWAASAPAPDTDVLFTLMPSAWIVVQAGGPDPLANALMRHSDRVPALCIDTDAPLERPFAHAVPSGLTVASCADFESEAQHTAGHVLSLLNEGLQPVALVAQDRLLMRRVRALLARQQVPLVDETGWKLSTTRAGAGIVALLRACDAGATNDDWLNWLKGCAAAWPGRAAAPWAVGVVEAAMRGRGWITPGAVEAERLPEAAAAFWEEARQVIEAFRRAPTSRGFATWRSALTDALKRCGAWAQLQDDDAGRQALAALHLRDVPSPEPDAEDAMPFDDFAAWVEDALEDASFVPEAPMATADAPVVITPLARAMLRPFAAAVFPGCDEKRLGAAPRPHALLDDETARELGLPCAQSQRDSELLSFAQVLRIPRRVLLRRLDDSGEPLSPSPLLERLGLALAQAAKGDLPHAAQPLVARALAVQPVRRPAPSAPGLLPARLSASACEALRACPYKFFALRLLPLRQSDELDETVEKRDYGTWLHEVLRRFHRSRTAPATAAEEEHRLLEAARGVQAEMRLDEALFLPYAASFARLAPRYVRWLHERDAQGARWIDGERELHAFPSEWAGMEMHGVIDRIDRITSARGAALELIDYKTGNAQRLRQQVSDPQEDTQLAFYAALMSRQPDGPAELAASYLPLDESEGIKPIEHEDVVRTAEQLVAGIGRDLERLRAGAALPALGEGRSCEVCEARGLCRRDEWSDLEPAA